MVYFEAKSSDDASPVTAPTQAANERYRPDLDGIRAFCILFTIANHTAGKPEFINGGVGVDIFFGLSGWLITALLIRERQNTETINLPAFYIRRAFRILPLYFATVLAYFVIGNLEAFLHLSGGAGKDPRVEFVEAIPYLITMCMEYRPENIGDVMGHAWTIGIEEKFYLLWPLILFITPNNKKLLLASAAITLAVIFILFGVTDNIIRGYVGLFFGSALATFVLTSDARQIFLQQRPLAGYALAFMAAAYAGLIYHPHVVWHIAVGMGGTVLIASLWFMRQQAIGRVLGFSCLPWLGRLTYAIYLLQSICIRVADVVLHALHLRPNFWLTFSLAYILCVAAAWIAHITVEKPMILIGKRLASRTGTTRTRIVEAG